MKLERLARWAVPGALLMGAAWFASGIVAFVAPGAAPPAEIGEPFDRNFILIEALHTLGEIGLLAALAGLYLAQKATAGRLGHYGFWAAFVGTLLILVAGALWFALVLSGQEPNELTGILFSLAVLGWLAGFPLLGAATLRAKVFPVWVGWLMIAWCFLGFPLFLVLLAYGVGGVVVGVIWLAIGYALWVQERAVAGIDVEEAGAPVTGA
jgi:hypothetical protein